MKNFRKIAIFIVITLMLCSIFSVTAFAAGEENGGTEGGKLDMNLVPESFDERLEYALQGTVTGMLMIFGVLTLLTLILYGSKYFFYDIPNKKKDNKVLVAKKEKAVEPKAEAPAPVAAPAPMAAEQNDGELVAVITAAVAAMIESGEYKNEFVGGFRVVSFKRNDKKAWNR